MSLVKGLWCTDCGRRVPLSMKHVSCPTCGGVLQVQYDFQAIAEKLSRETLSHRGIGVWRYRELLPIQNIGDVVSLGEGGTYLHKCRGLAEQTSLQHLYLKDETINPTGSFIDRGMAVELSMVRQARISRVCCASVGNMAVSLVAYAARAGLAARVLMAKHGGVDMGKFYQVLAYGADVETVRDPAAAERSLQFHRRHCHPVASTNPFFLEGIKTTILEVCEQMDWSMPDWVIVPMGSGGHISQIWKGILELRELGLCDGDNPHLVGVQSKSCSPIVTSFEHGRTDVAPCTRASVIARDIGVAAPRCGRSAIKAIRESGGTALAVADGDIIDAVRRLARFEGVFAEPSSATVIAGLDILTADGTLDSNDTIVCMVTGMGLKSPEVTRELLRDHRGLQRLLRAIEGRKFTGDLGRTKKRILEILSDGEEYGYMIWKRLSMEYGIRIKIPSVYQHLAELRAAGLVELTRTERTYQGRTRNYYALSDRGTRIVSERPLE
ncbi:MAG: threonine synthase [Candidatus Thorarchaeota archaeon]|nr:MAG: threonine synthase [Candidatus Thorarchaeota archaeon]